MSGAKLGVIAYALLLLNSSCYDQPTDAAVQLDSSLKGARQESSTSVRRVLSHADSEWPLAWSEGPFRQWYTAKNFNSLTVRETELNDDGDASGTVEYTSSARFTVMRIATGSRDSFTLYGFAQDNELVVEQWEVIPKGQNIVVSGSGVQSGQDELFAKQFDKKRIFKGLAHHLPLAVDADPLGRFVVIVDRSPLGVVSIRQIWATDGVPPTTLTASDAIPEVLEITSVNKYDHSDLGRVYFCTSDNFIDGHAIMLVDLEDDGNFDGSPIVASYEEFSQRGLIGYDVMRFLNRP